MKRVLVVFATASALACGDKPNGSTSPTSTTSSTVTRATTLDSFEGLEEPEVLYHPSSGGWTSDAFTNITNPSAGVFRFVLRFRPADDWWDGDRATTNNDRQRAEVKGLRYWPGTAGTFLVARTLAYSVGEWTSVRIRIRTSPASDGYVLASVNGDSFAGVTGVAVYRPDSTDYRPKWGSYRAVNTLQPYGDDTVEQMDISAQRIAN